MHIHKKNIQQVPEYYYTKPVAVCAQIIDIHIEAQIEINRLTVRYIDIQIDNNNMLFPKIQFFVQSHSMVLCTENQVIFFEKYWNLKVNTVHELNFAELVCTYYGYIDRQIDRQIEYGQIDRLRVVFS